jgi:hypothetical protein
MTPPFHLEERDKEKWSIGCRTIKLESKELKAPMVNEHLAIDLLLSRADFRTGLSGKKRNAHSR